jgi:hypothetical protein
MVCYADFVILWAEAEAQRLGYCRSRRPRSAWLSIRPNLIVDVVLAGGFDFLGVPLSEVRWLSSEPEEAGEFIRGARASERPGRAGHLHCQPHPERLIRILPAPPSHHVPRLDSRVRSASQHPSETSLPTPEAEVDDLRWSNVIFTQHGLFFFTAAHSRRQSARRRTTDRSAECGRPVFTVEGERPGNRLFHLSSFRRNLERGSCWSHLRFCGSQIRKRIYVIVMPYLCHDPPGILSLTNEAQ